MHRNARLTEWGRQELVRRVEAGTPPATVARQMNVSRDTVYKWCRRAVADPEGRWWLDRSSRPHRSPTKTRRKLERKILSLRRNEKLGPARIAGRLELASSTVHAVLARNQVSRLAWMDRPTGRVVRRYEHAHAGDLVHVDVKKLGQVPQVAAGTFTGVLRCQSIVRLELARPVGMMRVRGSDADTVGSWGVGSDGRVAPTWSALCRAPRGCSFVAVGGNAEASRGGLISSSEPAIQSLGASR